MLGLKIEPSVLEITRKRGGAPSIDQHENNMYVYRMRLALLFVLVSICCGGYSQTEQTTFLKFLAPTNPSLLVPDLPFHRIIVVDNQLDSTPISIRGLGHEKYEKLRLDTPTSQKLGTFLSDELKESLHGSGKLMIVLNECRFYTTVGQIRERGNKLKRVTSEDLLKINITLYSKANDSFEIEPEYLGTLDRFFVVERPGEIPIVLRNACIEAILVSANRQSPFPTTNIHRTKASVILLDDDLGMLPQPVPFDSLTKGESPFYKALSSNGQHTSDSIRIFQCFQDLKRGIATTLQDSLVFDEDLGLVSYLETGRNRKLVKNCWGILYGQSFYVRFNQNYFFEIQLNTKSATFRVPDFLSDMFTLQSMIYNHPVKLNRSLHHNSHAAASSTTLVANLAIAGVEALTDSRPKPSSKVTLLNSSSYSTIFRDCRIDPISGDIIYDFGPNRY